MTTLILHLGQQPDLAMQRGCACDPVTFWLHTDNLGMCVLRDLSDQRLTISIWHPVLRLDLGFRLDLGQEPLFEICAMRLCGRFRPFWGITHA